MTTQDDRLSPAGERTPRSETTRRQRRKLEQVIEGVRRQREHIMRLDGADPLRGGVAD